MNTKQIILSSLLLTILIFTIGILANYLFDIVRLEEIKKTISEQEINNEAYVLEKEFAEIEKINQCEIINSRIIQLKENIKKVGVDLKTYSGFSVFKKDDFDYQKRKYFLLQIKFYYLVNEARKKCNYDYIPILFFYKIDDLLSERQGFVLEDLGRKYENNIFVLSFDKDYEKEPLVKLLVDINNITSAPTIILENNKIEEIIYEGEIENKLQHILRKADYNAENYDFEFTLKATGFNKDFLIKELNDNLNKNISNFAKGDLMLVLGRINQNSTMICDSLNYYDEAFLKSNNDEEKAIIYETIASLGCGRNKKQFLLEASKLWSKIGNLYRSQIDEDLANNKFIDLRFNLTEINSNISVPKKFNNIIIGKTKIELDNQSLILSQVDRVYRDWLSGQLFQSPFGQQILTTFSERVTYNQTELLPEIGWHEGGRVKDLKQIVLKHIIATGTLAAKKDDKWYAVNDREIFSFEIPEDKLLYPTTRFLREDIAVLIDTHGVNMLVEQSIRNNVTAVISDCDHPGKVKAALYLSEHNISVACFPDKYNYLALGHNAKLVGSAPIKIQNNKAIIGDRAIKIKKNEPIVAINGSIIKYALWYYQTPTNYFSEIQKYTDLNVTYVTIDNYYQTDKAINKAEQIGARIIGIRVFNSDDYNKVRDWLLNDKRRVAILFHSASYPYGIKLFRELPEQTSFDDTNVEFQ